MTQGEKAAYLAAFVDGEGHIGLHTAHGRGGKYQSREICVTNTDKSLVDFVAQISRDLGFAPTTQFFAAPANKSHWAGKWVVRIATSKKYFELFAAIIPLQSLRKIEILRKILKSYFPSTSKKVNMICHQCGKSFRRSPSMAKRPVEKRFCSAACKDKGAEKIITMDCLQCGKPFSGHGVHMRARKYCSKPCAYIAMAPQKAAHIATLAKIASEARWRKSNAIH